MIMAGCEKLVTSLIHVNLKVESATQLDRTDADLSGVATPGTAATACEPPVLCGRATGSLYIAKKDQRGPQESSFKDRKHPGE